MERMPHSSDRPIPLSQRVKTFVRFMLDEIGKLDMNLQRQPEAPSTLPGDITDLSAQLSVDAKPLASTD